MNFGKGERYSSNGLVVIEAWIFCISVCVFACVWVFFVIRILSIQQFLHVILKSFGPVYGMCEHNVFMFFTGWIDFYVVDIFSDETKGKEKKGERKSENTNPLVSCHVFYY